MSVESQLAVELNKGDDHLNIWVDANNNGVRDDDDVNIYVTSGGGFYTTSPTFKQKLDETIQTRIKALAVALLQEDGHAPAKAEETLCELALELVVKATKETTDAAIAHLAAADPVWQNHEQVYAEPQAYAAPVAFETYAAEPAYVEPAVEQSYAAAEHYIAEAQPVIEAVYAEPALPTEIPAAYTTPFEPALEQAPAAFSYAEAPAAIAPIWVNLNAPKQ